MAWRLIFVAVVAALGQLWVRHHLGWGGDTPWIAAMILVLTFVDTILTKFMTTKAMDRLYARIKKKVVRVLESPLAMLACVVAILVALVVSSMTVIRGSDADDASKLTARLLRLDGTLVSTQPLADRASVARFPWLGTGPFGRPYRLAVDGYLEETITVYPLIGSNVSPERDLRRSPSVLFRPSKGGVQTLASGGSFTVTWQPATGSPTSLVPPQTLHDGAFLLGRAQPIPAPMVVGWRLDLTANGIPEPTLSQLLRKWMAFKQVPPAIQLAPGMRLVAEVLSRQKVLVARAEVVLGTDPLIDVLLLDL